MLDVSNIWGAVQPRLKGIFRIVERKIFLNKKFTVNG